MLAQARPRRRRPRRPGPRSGVVRRGAERDDESVHEPRAGEGLAQERAALADYTMNPGRDPLATAMAEHTFFSRETATGGRGVGGSGCGCN